MAKEVGCEIRPQSGLVDVEGVARLLCNLCNTTDLAFDVATAKIINAIRAGFQACSLLVAAVKFLNWLPTRAQFCHQIR